MGMCSCLPSSLLQSQDTFIHASVFPTTGFYLNWSPHGQRGVRLPLESLFCVWSTLPSVKPLAAVLQGDAAPRGTVWEPPIRDVRLLGGGGPELVVCILITRAFSISRLTRASYILDSMHALHLAFLCSQLACLKVLCFILGHLPYISDVACYNVGRDLTL